MLASKINVGIKAALTIAVVTIARVAADLLVHVVVAARHVEGAADAH